MRERGHGQAWWGCTLEVQRVVDTPSLPSPAVQGRVGPAAGYWAPRTGPGDLSQPGPHGGHSSSSSRCCSSLKVRVWRGAPGRVTHDPQPWPPAPDPLPRARLGGPVLRALDGCAQGGPTGPRGTVPVTGAVSARVQAGRAPAGGSWGLTMQRWSGRLGGTGVWGGGRSGAGRLPVPVSCWLCSLPSPGTLPVPQCPCESRDQGLFHDISRAKGLWDSHQSPT